MQSKYFKISEFIKFGGVGVIVTVASILSSFIWLKIIGTPLFITYILNYVFFIFISYTLNRLITYKRKFNFISLILYFFVYISGMVLGIILLHIFKKLFILENWIYSFLVVPFTTANNYIWSTMVFKKRKEKL